MMMKIFRLLLLPALMMVAVSCGKTEKKPVAPTSMALTVNSVPAGAEIYVNGMPQGKAPCAVNLMLGTPYIVAAELPGYRQKLHLFEPTQSPAAQEVTLSLEPNYGVLLVESHPEGAAISIDDKPVGAAPARMYAMKVGEHKIRADLHGHLPVEANVVIPPDGSPTVARINLESVLGTLNITSPTADVAVFVNEKEVGYAPYKAVVPEGSYDVVLRKDGFGEVQRKVEVKRSQEAVVNVALKELPSTLNIVTSPVGASIYFEGELRGLSPLKIENVEPGRYTILAKKEGFDDEEVSVRVNPGAETPLNITLTPNTGEIHVTAIPPGVSVYIDGRRVGSVEADPVDPRKGKVFVIGSLPAGSYQVRIAHKDGRPAFQNETVSVTKGRTARTAPMKLWVPNAWIKTKLSNARIKVYLENELTDEIIVQPAPGVTQRYRRDELAGPVEPIDITEEFIKEEK